MRLVARREAGDEPPHPQRIGYVDAWRFVAVSMVVLSHYLTGDRGIQSRWPWTHDFVNHLGSLGVLIFFCISGFVITNRFADEKRQKGKIDLRGFYIRRSLRILPPLFLYLAVLAVLSGLGVLAVSRTELWRAATFSCNLPLAVGCSWYTAHTWSLAYEEQFYLLFPLGLLLLNFVERPSRLALIVGAMMVAASVSRTLPIHHFFGDYLGYVIFLLVGCITALYRMPFSRIVDRMPIPIWVIALVAMCVLITASPPLGNWSEPVFSGLCPLLVTFVVFGTPVRLRRAFENRLLRHLGVISYSVYLWQQLIMKADLSAITSSIPILIVAVFVLAHFSFRYFEMPLIRLGQRWSSSTAVRAEPA